MMRKIIIGLVFYFLVMLTISGISSIFSESLNGEKAIKTRDASVNEIKQGKTKIEYKKIPIRRVESHNLTTVAAETTVASSFGFSIKITKRNKNEQFPLYSQAFIGNLTDYNCIEEIEKRKTKVWYKRKFALYMIKNEIKILKSKKWKLNILV